MADFDRIGSHTPLLSNLKPHGKVKDLKLYLHLNSLNVCIDIYDV